MPASPNTHGLPGIARQRRFCQSRLCEFTAIPGLLVFSLLCVCLLSSWTNASTMQKFYVSNITYPNATCNDGTQAFFYYSAPERRKSEKWIVYMEGGLFCSNKMTCTERKESERHWTTSDESIYPLRVEGTDLFSRGDTEPFNHYNQVYIGYCTSDLYLAQRVRPLFTSDGKDFFVRGYHVVRAIFNTLETMGMQNDFQIVLSGTSAGGMGAMNHAVNFRQEGKYPNLTLLIDSAWFVDHDGILGETLGTIEYITDIPFAACRVPTAGVSALPCCLSAACLAQVFISPLQMPVFFITSSSDMFVISLLIRNSTGHPRFDLANRTTDIKQELEIYTGAVNRSQISDLPPSASLFQISCGQHAYFRNVGLRSASGSISTNNSLPLNLNTAGLSLTYHWRISPGYWKTVRFGGKTLETAMNDWLMSNFTRQVMWDTCGGFMCNRLCPDSYVSELMPPQLPETAEAVFLVSAIAVIALPVFLKAFLFVKAFLLKVETYKLEEDNIANPIPEFVRRKSQRESSISVGTKKDTSSLWKVLQGQELQLAC